MTEIWVAKIITLFPEMFPGPLGESVVGQALKSEVWKLDTVNIRDFGEGKHKNVDDTPAGGGAGMVLRADIIDQALEAASTSYQTSDHPVIYLSPRGAPFDQNIAWELANKKGVTLLCGRFEGIDQRVLDKREIQEVSLGDFVLSGGEIAAMAMLDAIIRLLPGVLGANESLSEESFEGGLLEYPHYTRPREWEGLNIPDVLLSGDHGRIAKWRKEQSEELTRTQRPDLWKKYNIDKK